MKEERRRRSGRDCVRTKSKYLTRSSALLKLLGKTSPGKGKRSMGSSPEWKVMRSDCRTGFPHPPFLLLAARWV